MILTVTLNPSLDQTLFLPKLSAGDTNRVERVEMDAGGKGLNLSRVAAELGGKTLALGFLGGGPTAFIHQVLDLQSVDHAFVPIRGETRTNFSVETTDGAPPTTLNSRGPDIQVDEWAQFCEHFQKSLAHASWVCLCGSKPPGVSADAYTQLAQMAHEAGKKVLIDADGDALERAMQVRPDLIKPNRKEAERLLGVELPDEEASVRAILSLHERIGGGSRTALLSLGSDGALLKTESGLYRGRSPRVEPVSTVGSGDSMLGAFLASLQRGDTEADAFRWGLAAGAATATTNGAQIGRRAVIEILYQDAEVVRLA